MIRYLSLAAALAVALAEPAFAAHGNKGHGARPQAPRAKAPAVAHRSAPKARAPIAQRAPQRPQRAPSVAANQQRARVQQQRNIASQRSVAAQRQQNLQAQRSVAAQRQRNLQTQQSLQAQRTQAVRNNQVAQRNRANAIAAQRAQAVRNQRNTIAFGGQTRINNNSRVDVRNHNSYYRPPSDVYRNWHHGNEYSWNNHRYHWRNGGWVIIDASPNYYYNDAPAYGYTTYGYDEDSAVLAQVQSQLNARGYNAGPADGVMGGRTRDAIEAYQDDHGLKDNGKVTDELLRSLDLK